MRDTITTMNRQDAISKLRAALPGLHARHGVVGLWLFGSVARGDATAASDVDVLVDFDRSVTLFGIARLGAELEDVLGVPVDVGARQDLRASVRDSIMREALRVA